MQLYFASMQLTMQLFCFLYLPILITFTGGVFPYEFELLSVITCFQPVKLPLVFPIREVC